MEPSPVVRRRVVGGVVCVNVVWLVWRGWGEGRPAAGVGWRVMGIKVSSYFKDDLINLFYKLDFFFFFFDSFSLRAKERRRKWKEERGVM